MNDTFEARLRMLRIIHGALCAGVVSVLVFALAMRADLERPEETPQLGYVLLAVSLPQVLIALFGMGLFEPAWRTAFRQQHGTTGTSLSQRSEVMEHWWGIAQTRFIIRAALLEGAALMNAIAYFVEGPIFSLVAASVCLGFLVGQFPTRDGIETWIAQQVALTRQ